MKAETVYFKNLPGAVLAPLSSFTTAGGYVSIVQFVTSRAPAAAAAAAFCREYPFMLNFMLNSLSVSSLDC